LQKLCEHKTEDSGRHESILLYREGFELTVLACAWPETAGTAGTGLRTPFDLAANCHSHHHKLRHIKSETRYSYGLVRFGICAVFMWTRDFRSTQRFFVFSYVMSFVYASDVSDIQKGTTNDIMVRITAN
jgi:hypothetical protein